MKLPVVSSGDVAGRSVLARGDFDVDDGVNPRADSVRDLVRFLQDSGAREIKVIGHRGDYPLMADLVREFPEVMWNDDLRDNPGEKENEEMFAAQIADGYGVYINESFAVSHRRHASIVALPRIMKARGDIVAVGPRFAKEAEMLTLVLERPGKKVLVVGGSKVEDKLRYTDRLAGRFDTVLLGGKLPLEFANYAWQFADKTDMKFKVGKLRPDGLDIDEETIKLFEEEIATAEIIVGAGVMGKYEDQGTAEGTRRVLTAIAGTRAYKVAGGGDIERAIDTYNFSDNFDWISVGGGAMLEFLGTGTLPGIESITG